MSEFQRLLDERRIANHSEITIDFYQVWGNDTVFLVLKVSNEFRFISGKAKKKKGRQRYATDKEQNEEIFKGNCIIQAMSDERWKFFSTAASLFPLLASFCFLGSSFIYWFQAKVLRRGKKSTFSCWRRQYSNTDPLRPQGKTRFWQRRRSFWWKIKTLFIPKIKYRGPDVKTSFERPTATVNLVAGCCFRQNCYAFYHTLVFRGFLIV